MPPDGWSSRACTIGGSFDCDGDEYYTQLEDTPGPQGPAGPQGPLGPQGLPGATGPQGENGVSATVTPLPPDSAECGVSGGVVITGAGSPAVVCNGKSGTTGQGAGMALSGNFLFPPGPAIPNTPAPIVNVPDLSLSVIVSESAAGVVVSTDGGVQVNSAVAGQYVIVDMLVFVDGAATETEPDSSKLIARRRIFAANAVAQQAVTNWSMSVVDVERPGGPYTYRVAAQLVASNGSNAVVSGSSTTVPWLRGTLTAVVINK